jgi:hypothetical protein
LVWHPWYSFFHGTSDRATQAVYCDFDPTLFSYHMSRCGCLLTKVAPQPHEGPAITHAGAIIEKSVIEGKYRGLQLTPLSMASERLRTETVEYWRLDLLANHRVCPSSHVEDHLKLARKYFIGRDWDDMFQSVPAARLRRVTEMVANDPSARQDLQTANAFSEREGIYISHMGWEEDPSEG